MGDYDVANPSDSSNSQLVLDDPTHSKFWNFNDLLRLKEPNYNVTKSVHKNLHDKGTAEEKIKLSIYHQNIQGLKNKISEFIITLTEVKPHLICLSEHGTKYSPHSYVQVRS